jgi:hypothetical protein
MKSKLFAILAILSLVSVVAIGCDKGPKKVPITGTVMVGDELVETGSITFDPADGQGPSDGARILNGQFEAEVTTGEKRVKAYGSKVVGQVEMDPVLNPGVMSNKYEDFPAKVFQEEVKVKIEKKNQVVEIKFSGDGPAK